MASELIPFGMEKKRVVVAMSGGVDSSVAAALLAEEGYDVVGVMLRLWAEADDGKGPTNRCCALDAQYDAERVAELLGIPFYLVNVSGEFEHRVVDHFASEYASGRTPNPCIECNREIRFGLLLRWALAMEAEYLATGHYARVRHQDGRFFLWRGVDRQKDQSYVLHVLGQAQLAHVLFPVGNYRKAQVRSMASKRGLPVADRKDSQDLCFVRDGDYRRFMTERMPESVLPGPIRDSVGRPLGEHSGLAHYTIGQRRGIRVAGPDRLYVLALEPAENALIVGTDEELGQDSCLARRINWVFGEPPNERFQATAKIRYKARDARVAVKMLDPHTASIRFTEAQRDITPGQALVLYRGEEVLGGGIIS